MTDTQDSYDIFQRNRQELVNLISRTQTVFKKLKIESWDQSLAQLNNKVQSEHFKVMVIGEFKRGKSTVINAMLGEEVLPAYAIPCTAVINEIKWGEERRAILHFRDPIPEPLPKKIPEQAMDHIQKTGGRDTPPLDIPYEELESYVAIPDPAKKQKESVAETPYEKVELFWPLGLCESGVEIIDSPGLNEDGARAKITNEYIPKVDAVLFVISCIAPVSESEMKVIDRNLHGAGHEDIFFIFNRFDQIRPRERDRTVSYGQNALRDETSFGTDGIFFISALDALEGRLDKDDSMVEKSGILKLEESLTRFLTDERAKVKLLQPARELVHAIQEVRGKIIPAQRGMLEESLEGVEKKYREIEPRLEDAERSKQHIISNINLHRNGLSRDVRDAVEKKLREIADRIPEWVEGVGTETEIKLLTFKQKEQAETLVKEIVNKTTDQIENELYEWKEETLNPIIDKKLEEMMTDIKGSVDTFYTRIDQINADFSGITSAETELGKGVSGSERFVASLGGFLLGSIFSAGHGAIFGFKGLATSIATQIGIAVVTVGVLGVTNPLVIIGALLGGGLVTGLIKKEFMVDKAKKKIGKGMQHKFKEDIYPTAAGIAENVHQQTDDLVGAADSTLEQEIKVIREQAEAVLNDKKAGKERVQETKAMLNKLEKEINGIDRELTDLIFAVGGK
uniref:GTPase Der n=1 Tax=Candidatus Methanogaster sp. ANME-2c ERB4 TaxID=2759911 RepID=A0A7G9Y137_9EURY|nr:GTPase Der [Methanosarcinales archaeon ANME-2c ERB4]QNO42498.1 GTPase Der [Methanosarcinales archaeon ANME-2c ERB4]